eukprot:gene8022-8849_t
MTKAHTNISHPGQQVVSTRRRGRTKKEKENALTRAASGDHYDYLEGEIFVRTPPSRRSMALSYHEKVVSLYFDVLNHHDVHRLVDFARGYLMDDVACHWIHCYHPDHPSFPPFPFLALHDALGKIPFLRHRYRLMALIPDAIYQPGSLKVRKGADHTVVCLCPLLWQGTLVFSVPTTATASTPTPTSSFGRSSSTDTASGCNTPCPSSPRNHGQMVMDTLKQLGQQFADYPPFPSHLTSLSSDMHEEVVDMLQAEHDCLLAEHLNQLKRTTSSLADSLSCISTCSSSSTDHLSDLATNNSHSYDPRSIPPLPTRQHSHYNPGSPPSLQMICLKLRVQGLLHIHFDQLRRAENKIRRIDFTYHDYQLYF